MSDDEPRRPDEIDYNDFEKECHPRNDPNVNSATSMFAYSVKWCKSYHPYSYDLGGPDPTKMRYERGRSYICCLTGCVCHTYTGGAYASTHNEYDCNMCRVPDRMPNETAALTRIICEKNMKNMKKKKR